MGRDAAGLNGPGAVSGRDNTAAEGPLLVEAAAAAANMSNPCEVDWEGLNVGIAASVSPGVEVVDVPDVGAPVETQRPNMTVNCWSVYTVIMLGCRMQLEL